VARHAQLIRLDDTPPDAVSPAARPSSPASTDG